MRRILFIELLGGIGDVLIALPAINALGRSHPQSHLTVLTFAPGGDLLQSNPLVHRVLYAPAGKARQAVEQLLAQESFDLIISDVSYKGIAELVQTSGAQKVVTNLWRSPPANERVGDRFLRVLLAEGVISSESVHLQETLVQLTAAELATARQFLGAAYRPVLVFCPDAGMAIKRWSVENFIAVGKALQQQFGATILVSAGSDRPRTEQIVQVIGAHPIPQGSLRQLAAFMALSDLAIGGDTGPLRIAAALNIPTLTLFGPSWHGRYGQPAPHVNLQGFPACPDRVIHNFTIQPCWYSGECPYNWETCLEDISPTAVIDAAVSLLEGKGKKMEEGGKSGEMGESLQPYPPSPIHHSLSTIPYPLPPEWQSSSNLLVLRLDNIGDVVMTSPAVRALRENLPHAKITYLASPAGAIAADLLPGVDEVISWRVLWQDLGRLEFDPQREWRLIEMLRSRQFDAAVIFTSFSQSPHAAAWVCHLAGIPLRLGESKEGDRGTLTHAAPLLSDETHQVERNLQLIESVGFQVCDRRLSLSVSTPSISLPEPYILFNPWTSCQSRTYSPEQFAIAAQQLSEITGYKVVITGVEKDRERSLPLLELLPGAIDLIGKTNLAELVGLIAGASLVLSNNTSTMHIADATRTPNVILFAGTDLKSQWKPRHSLSRLLHRATVCSPCYAFTCPYQQECLNISPEKIVAAGLELLQASRPLSYLLPAKD
jgi:ADP-heptose:LPS heptosyltransferase